MLYDEIITAMIIKIPHIITLVLKLHNKLFNSVSCFFFSDSVSEDSIGVLPTCIYKVHITPANTPHATITNGNAIP